MILSLFNRFNFFQLQKKSWFRTFFLFLKYVQNISKILVPSQDCMRKHRFFVPDGVFFVFFGKDRQEKKSITMSKTVTQPKFLKKNINIVMEFLTMTVFNSGILQFLFINSRNFNGRNDFYSCYSLIIDLIFKYNHYYQSGLYAIKLLL